MDFFENLLFFYTLAVTKIHSSEGFGFCRFLLCKTVKSD